MLHLSKFPIIAAAFMFYLQGHGVATISGAVLTKQIFALKL